MNDPEPGTPPLFGKWQPSAGFEPDGISSDDDSTERDDAKVFAAFGRRPGPGPGMFNQAPFQRHQNYNGPRYRKNQVNTRKTHFSSTPSRESYWNSTGPKTELRKILGSTLELPMIAPMAAPPEDKKIILTQTKDKIADAATEDWQAKMNLLCQRFAAAVPNVANEAKVKMSKLRTWPSPAYRFGPTDGYTTDFTSTDLNDTMNLKYLGMDIIVKPSTAVPNNMKIPELPGERTIQALVKVPRNQTETDVDPICTNEVLANGDRFVATLKENNLDITFGKMGKNFSFDKATFDKEFKDFLGECLFYTVYAILNRDYVGKGLTKDIHKRLRDCRQLTWTNGTPVTKSVDEFHADFMRLVGEFDIDENINTNLPNIAFHNLTRDLQNQLLQMNYEPPLECNSVEVQYDKLAELHEKALEAERKLTHWESMIRKIGATNRFPSKAFATMPKAQPSVLLTQPSPQDPDFMEDTTMENLEADIQSELQEVKQQAGHLMVCLSIAEKAIRTASGEKAPLECWGCKGHPKYHADRFHRFRRCPNRNDPEVRAKFEQNLREHINKRKEGQYYGRNTERQHSSPSYGNSNRPPWKPDRGAAPDQKEKPETKTFISHPFSKPSEEKDLLEEFGLTTDYSKHKKLGTVYCKIATPKIPNLTSEEQAQGAADTGNEEPPPPELKERMIFGLLNSPSVWEEQIRLRVKELTALGILESWRTGTDLVTPPPPESNPTNSKSKDPEEPATSIPDIKEVLPHMEEPVEANTNTVTLHSRETTQDFQPDIEEEPPSTDRHIRKFWRRNQKLTRPDAEDLRKIKPTEEYIRSLKGRIFHIRIYKVGNSLNAKDKKQSGHLMTSQKVSKKRSAEQSSLRVQIDPPGNKKVRKECESLTISEQSKSESSPPTRSAFSFMVSPKTPSKTPTPDNTGLQVPNHKEEAPIPWKRVRPQTPFKEEQKETPNSAGIQEESSKMSDTLSSGTWIDYEESHRFSPIPFMEDKPLSAEGTSSPTDFCIDEPFLKEEMELTMTDKQNMKNRFKAQIELVEELVPTGNDLEEGEERKIMCITTRNGITALWAEGYQPNVDSGSLADLVRKRVFGFACNTPYGAEKFAQFLAKEGPTASHDDDSLWKHAGHFLFRARETVETKKQEDWDILASSIEGAVLMEESTRIWIYIAKTDVNYMPFGSSTGPKSFGEKRTSPKSLFERIAEEAVFETRFPEPPRVTQTFSGHAHQQLECINMMDQCTSCMAAMPTFQPYIGNNLAPFQELPNDPNNATNMNSHFVTGQGLTPPVLAFGYVARPYIAPELARQNSGTENLTQSYQHLRVQSEPNWNPEVQYQTSDQSREPQALNNGKLATSGTENLEQEKMTHLQIQKKVNTRKIDEIWRYPSNEDQELAKFLARTKGEGVGALVLPMDLQSAGNILNWERMVQRAEQRKQEMFQAGITPAAAEGLFNRCEQQGIEVQDEEFIGERPLPLPVELTTDEEWKELRLEENISDADAAFAWIWKRKGKVTTGDVIKATRIRNFARAVKNLRETEFLMDQQGINVYTANRLLQSFRNLPCNEEYVFYKSDNEEDVEATDPVTSWEDDSTDEEGSTTPESGCAGFNYQQFLNTQRQHEKDDDSEVEILERDQLPKPNTGFTSAKVNKPEMAIAVHNHTHTHTHVAPTQTTDGSSEKQHNHFHEHRHEAPIRKKPQAAESYKPPAKFPIFNTTKSPTPPLVSPKPRPILLARKKHVQKTRSALRKNIWKEKRNNPKIPVYVKTPDSPQTSFYAIIDTGTNRSYALMNPIRRTREVSRNHRAFYKHLVQHATPLTQRIVHSPEGNGTVDAMTTVELTLGPEDPGMIDQGDKFAITLGLLENIGNTDGSPHILLGTDFMEKASLNIKIPKQPNWLPNQSPFRMLYKVSPYEGRTFEITSEDPETGNSEIARITRAAKQDSGTLETDILFPRLDITTAYKRTPLTPRPAAWASKPEPEPKQPEAKRTVPEKSIYESKPPPQKKTRTTRNLITAFTTPTGKDTASPESDRKPAAKIPPPKQKPPNRMVVLACTPKKKKTAQIETRIVDGPLNLVGWDIHLRGTLRVDKKVGIPTGLKKLVHTKTTFHPPIAGDENTVVFVQPFPQYRKTNKSNDSSVNKKPGDLAIAKAMTYLEEDTNLWKVCVSLKNKTGTTQWTNPSREIANVICASPTPTESDTEDSEEDITPRRRHQGPSKGTNQGRTYTERPLEEEDLGNENEDPDLESLLRLIERDSIKKHPNIHTLIGILRAYKSLPRHSDRKIALTENLPHIELPVGDKELGTPISHLPKVKGVLDTGSGLNIGNKDYWSSVNDRFPELIEEFGEMSEEPGDMIKVGGIEKEGEGAICTHYVILKTPYVHQGEQVTLGIALTNELSCNLILGLPLIIRAKLTVNLWEKYVTSPVFKASFPIDFHPPYSRESVPIQDGDIVTLETAVEKQQ